MSGESGEPASRRMPIRLRLLLGALTLWAAIYAIAALTADIGLVPDDGAGTSGDRFASTLFRTTSALNALGLLLLYAWLGLRDPRLKAFDRVAWVFAMMFFYPAAVPLFWYLRIWRDQRSPAE